MGSLKTDSKEACCQACQNEPKCAVGVLYHGLCYLKRTTDRPKRNPGRLACINGRAPRAVPYGHDNRIDFEGDSSPHHHHHRPHLAPPKSTTKAPAQNKPFSLCRYREGIDYEGGDIKFIYDVKSREDCCKHCVQERNCTVSVFYQNFCYLKHSTQAKQAPHALAGTVACEITTHNRDVVRRYDADLELLGGAEEEDRRVGRTLNSIILFAVAGVVGLAAVALLSVRSAGGLLSARPYSNFRSHGEPGRDAIDGNQRLTSDGEDEAEEVH
jgi:hypothetical protein